jgi:type II secretion system protein H
MRWKEESKGPKGFTLIELMVVVVLIGIMTALILPEMRGTFEDALLRSTSRKLMTVCSLAYSQAVTVNQMHRVRLDLRNGRYTVEKKARGGEQNGRFVPLQDITGSEGALDKRITIELRRLDEQPDTNPEERNPSGREEEEKSARGEVISFYPDGTADADEILLKDREGFELRLRINPTTARVRIVEKKGP